MRSLDRVPLHAAAFLLALCAPLFVTGCGDDNEDDDEEIVATATVAPTGTVTPPTPVAATATPSPSVIATATFTVVEGGTPTPTATVEGVATATPTTTGLPGGEQFGATLSGAQEVPPVDSEGEGQILLTLSPDATSLDFELDISGLALEEISQAHLHVGPPGVIGPIVLFLIGETPDELPVSGTLTADDLIPSADVGVTTFEEFVAALRAGDVYANVHTPANPIGEIRGQILVPTTFVATLSGDQEVPPVETDGSGSATLVLSGDETRLDFTVEVAGMDAAEITGAHLHVGPPGVNGPIVLFLTGDPPISLPLQGVLTEADLIPSSEVGVETFADFVAALKAGDVYVNVHTNANPDGEIRGQLQGSQLFTAELSGIQEVPPVDTSASGRAQVVLNPERDGLRFALAVSELTSEEITEAHIHVAPVGENGPIVLFLAPTGFTGLRAGVLDPDDLIANPEIGIETFADFVAALEAGNTYVNVHTNANPEGEVRGQLGKP